MSKVWSTYQETIFEFALNGNGNCIVEAMPGSGKTTVLEEIVRRLPRNKQILALTFTCLARDQLKAKLGDYSNVTVQNLNGFGNSCINGYKKVNKYKVSNIFKFKVMGLEDYDKERFKIFKKYESAIIRLVGLLKSQMVWTDEDFNRNWKDIAFKYDVTLPEEIVEFEDYLRKTFQLDRSQRNPIDFDDQIAIPIREGYSITQYPFVLVDEAQDLTPCQIELTLRAVDLVDGRGFWVGDRNQSIYFFRGADSKAMDNIKLMTSATELPLSICYRCPKSVVREAQAVVPGILYHEDSPEGSVTCIESDEFRLKAQPGDYVLCRTTAPLVRECLKFIRDGVAARVKGREVGTDMQKVIETVSKGDVTVDVKTFLGQLRTWYDEQAEKLKKMDREEKRILLDDKYNTIRVLCEEANCVDDVLKRLDAIFTDTDEKNVIMLMTGHKAKGLETANVFILRPDLLPHKMAKSEEALVQEYNLKFVMITRSMCNLYWVTEKENVVVE